MSPRQMFFGQLSLGQLSIVKEEPGKLPLKFGQIGSVWDIADIEFLVGRGSGVQSHFHVKPNYSWESGCVEAVTRRLFLSGAQVLAVSIFATMTSLDCTVCQMTQNNLQKMVGSPRNLKTVGFLEKSHIFWTVPRNTYESWMLVLPLIASRLS